MMASDILLLIISLSLAGSILYVMGECKIKCVS